MGVGRGPKISGTLDGSLADPLETRPKIDQKTNKHTNKQTNPQIIHNTAKLSAQCKKAGVKHT